MKQLIKSIQAFSQSISQDIEDMKTVVDRTFDIVVDSRYKVLKNILFAAYMQLTFCQETRITLKVARVFI